MAEALGAAASIITVIATAGNAVKSLRDTVGRYRKRDRTLIRLYQELEDLAHILNSLGQVIELEASMLALLERPIERCSQVCREFQQSMEQFAQKPSTGLRDWARLEFMRGDINDFIETLANYKSTITIALGTINLNFSKVSQDVFREYEETILETVHNLNMHLQRIDKKIAGLTIDPAQDLNIKVNLDDERAVTEQCLRVCQNAMSHMEELENRKLPLPRTGSDKVTSGDDYSKLFEAQVLTQQVFEKNRGNLANMISSLQEKLALLVSKPLKDCEEQRSRLQVEMEMAKQLIEVCKAASEISQQKVYRVGEVIAENNSDQVVVTTLADLFDVRKAYSKDHSAQLVGSMDADSLQLLVGERYKSRFGSAVHTAGSTDLPLGSMAQPTARHSTQDKPTSNAVRKRVS